MKRFFTILIALLFCSAGLLCAQDFTVGDLNYFVNEDEVTVTVTGHVDGINATGALVIPETVTYSGLNFSVTAIGPNAFTLCSGLTSVSFPNSLIEIGGDAFYGCTGITSFSIPNAVNHIGSSAFYETGWYDNQPDGVLYKDNCCLGYKGNLSTGALQIQEGTRLLASDAFFNCPELTSVTLPNSLNAIPYRAFGECNGLTSITIPNSVYTIDEEAFVSCTHLTSFNIPNTVTYIGWRAFYETGWFYNQSDGVLYKDNCCIDYKGDKPTGALQIAEGTRLISYFVFGDCYELTSLSLPSSLEFINAEAFSLCSDIASIETKATTPPVLGDFVFSEFINFAIPVTIPDGTMAAYRNAPGWNRFTNFMEVSGQNISEIRVDGYTAPAWGEHPDFEMELAAGINCTIDEISWLWRTDSEDEELTPESVFDRDYGFYYMSISFLPAENYHFDDDVHVYFNNQASIYNPEYSGTVGPVFYAYTIDYQLSEPGTLNYSFEDGTLQNWEAIDDDGDGHGWMPRAGAGHNGSNYFVTSESYDESTETPLDPDNYLISPQVSLGGSINFWACAEHEYYPEEHFAVAVSTSTPEPSNFVIVNEWTLTAKHGSWHEFSADLADYAGQTGYVAIRHFNSSDNFRLNIDDIHITEGGDIPVILTYTLSVTCDSTQGIVRGSGFYEAGSIVTITAIPHTGYEFDRWNDNNMENPRNVTVNADISLMAYFKQTGVNEMGETALNVYPNPAHETLHVKGLDSDTTVEIYNSLGVLVKTLSPTATNEISINDLTPGLYTIRNGKQIVRFVKTL